MERYVFFPITETSLLKTDEVFYLAHETDYIPIGVEANGKHWHIVPGDGLYNELGAEYEGEKLDEWELALLKRFHWTWFHALRKQLNSEGFKNLNKKLNNEARKTVEVFPKREDVYNAFSTSLHMTKVVLVGQSPYPNKYNANGFAFATNNNLMPDSLQAIVTATNFVVKNDLSNWINQGVLLLNTFLTTSRNGDYEDWLPFTKLILKTVAAHTQSAYVLMGKVAQQNRIVLEKAGVDPTFIIDVEHPAFAVRQNRAWIYDDCFNRVNNLIYQPIEWSLF